MGECKEKGDDGSVACCVCMTEVPKSVAASFEGEDYVVHFCGADCHQKWREQQDDE